MKVALVVKDSPSTRNRTDRNMGYWSYPVPEFEWTHFVFGGPRAYADELNDYDVVIQEDAGPIHYKNLKKPLVFVSIDGTLSADHLDTRLKRAAQADLILVDHEPLEPYKALNIPTRRWGYCVNDCLMKDYGQSKTIDVSFHCAGNGQPERKQVRQLLSDYCQASGLVFQSGILALPEYARAMARGKIVVNWPRVPGNRPHRVLDAMACGACLVTGPIPDGDERVPGRDFLQVNRIDDLISAIEYLLNSGDWQQIAGKGKKLIAKYHTWTIRARQLRAILKEEL